MQGNTTYNELRFTGSADKGYNTRDLVKAACTLNVAPLVTTCANLTRSSAVDRGTTRYAGYALNQHKRIAQSSGWHKTICSIR